MDINFNPINLIPILLFLEIPVFIWGIIDTTLLMRPKGKLKRGIRVWKEQLDPVMVQNLKNLQENKIVKERRIFSSRITWFVLVEQEQRLINPDRKWFSTSWPIMGYINLRNGFDELEYRMSLPMLIVIFPFLLILIGFVILWINFWIQRKMMLETLLRL